MIISVAPRIARFGYVRKTRPQEHDVAVRFSGVSSSACESSTGSTSWPDFRTASSIFAMLRLGLLHAAVGHQPARALGEGARDDDHDDREHGAHQEREPPADVGGERVQEDQRGERAEDRAGPVAAVDPDVDAAPVLRGHHLVDRGVDRRVLAADPHPRDEPRPVEPGEPDPAAVVDRERCEPGAEQVQEQRDDQQPLAPELVGLPPEIRARRPPARRGRSTRSARPGSSVMSSVSGWLRRP